jgi:parallel beta-helix repeat protein
MKRICLAVGIILLFMGTCIIPAIAQDMKKPLPTSRGTWLYVGGSGPGNYTKIQDAIDNASDGDTVFVYEGIYHKENSYDQLLVSITKSICLIGEDKNTTILQGSGKYGHVTVSANNVTISGFTLQNGGGQTYPGQCVYISQKSNIIIYNNIFKNNPNGGIYCNQINNCTFSNNSFIENYCAICVTGSDNCSVTSNLFINNGIAINIGSQREFYIQGNEFRNNEDAVYISNGVGVKILENNFINNTRHATFVRWGGWRYLFEIMTFRQEWKSNYWDNQRLNDVKIIFGRTEIWFSTSIPMWPFILIYPSFEFDRTPAQEPYDISGTT